MLVSFYAISAVPGDDNSVSEYFPILQEFKRLASKGNLVPVYREILADMDTPVSAFCKLGLEPYSFLLESVEGGERIARYSFLGSDPFCIIRSKGDLVHVTEDGVTREIVLSEGQDPLSIIQQQLERYTFAGGEGLPAFCGGAVGYMGYDTVRFFEKIPDSNPDQQQLDDCVFMLTDSLLVFDHVQHRIKIVVNARIEDDPEAAYSKAVAKIEELAAKLQKGAEAPPQVEAGDSLNIELVSNVGSEKYKDAVSKCKEYINAGDVIQVVLSQRFSTEVSAHSFNIYRALRSLNPSPYMYYLRLENGVDIVGTSPEILVRQQQGKVTVRPIAGTRPRGKTMAEDHFLEEELLADTKEIAEHIMLVDLGRNDIGRVCRYASVKVDDLMYIERYSHVMHIVSNVVGQLEDGQNSFDVIRATFPAGTVSGAPKIRAMEIIDELEITRRGAYAGALGYISFSGDMDMAITIRTIVIKDGIAHVQAGAGIVADSDPEKENQECINKAKALVRALELAERGLEQAGTK